MALYLEQYLDGLQKLPSELMNNMQRLREMDEQVCSEMQQADKLVRVYMKQGKKNAKSDKFAAIKTLTTHSLEVAEAKVELAAATYELVDKYIRRLDADLIRFEGDIKRRLLDTEKTPSDDTPNRSHKKKKAAKRAGDQVDGGDAKKMKSTTKIFGMSLETSNLHTLTGTALLQQIAGAGAKGNPGDMRIDPNEPTYCECKQVSFGEMVACDNEECPVEWFHFACVGITVKPKGKWYCTRCASERKKK